MKTLLLIMSLFFILPAYASYYQFDCSSADGNVKWQAGHSENGLVVRTFDFEKNKYNEVTYDLREVEIEFLKETTIDNKESYNRCTYSSDFIKHAQMIVTPSKNSAEEAKKNEFTGKIDIFVICHEHISSLEYCED